MKKGLLILILAALVAGGAFAIDMSAGGGLDLGLGFAKDVDTMITIGAYGFFDATYAEASVGFGYMLGDYSGLAFSIGVLGKFPIEISREITVFPAAGITLSVPEFDFDYKSINLNIGGGLDYSLSRSMYIRGMLLYGTDFDAFFKAHSFTIRAGVGFRF
ncbi:MAG: hypothetical protein FWD47_10840 [Treponema sp.]|nr:hypothetical protein [Treponema sp.]